MIYRVVLAPVTQKQLRKAPRHVVVKLQAWVEAVETQGLEEVRKVPGFHDEPLHGKRKGQRSIRLSKAYRAIYKVDSNSEAEFVSIEKGGKIVSPERAARYARLLGYSEAQFVRLALQALVEEAGLELTVQVAEKA